ncbi:MAG: hypothetical protein SVU32_04960, partial [Candidatus Nanohaloarchaea archaeon]|nr:hypothetical protein [Candidatus Nanohaloarchaea archaeon]
PFQFKVDIFTEFKRLIGQDYTVYTLDRTLNEALNIEDGKYRRMVKKLVDLKDVEVINTKADRPVDQALYDLGQQGFIICTNDTELKNRLEEDNLPYIYLRQQNHLEGANLDYARRDDLL